MFFLKKVSPAVLSNYLLQHHIKGYYDIIPQKATNIKITNFKKIRGGMNEVYAFSIILFHKGKTMLLKLILKLYEDRMTAEKEYLTLKTLKYAGFLVPHVYILEKNENLLGRPFIIMEKIDGKNIKDYIKNLSTKEIFNFFEQLAETLASLHKLDIKDFNFLEQPKDKYAYAKKQSLFDEMWAKNIVKEKDFIWISRWLETNANRCPCYRYSLLHGDMNVNNFIITDGGKIFLLDWTWAEVGDPLMDLGYIYYHVILDLFNENYGGKIFSHFLKYYIKKSGLNIDRFQLRFYMVAAGLREAIFLKYQAKRILNPLYLKKIFEAKYLPALLFFPWYYRSKFKQMQRFLRNITTDYETDMFRTIGGKILQ